MYFGPHSLFIWLAYLIVLLTISVLILWLVIDGERQRKALADLEARGVGRRGSGSGSDQ